MASRDDDYIEVRSDSVSSRPDGRYHVEIDADEAWGESGLLRGWTDGPSPVL